MGVFLFTRAMAVKESQLDVRVAAVWFGRGEEQVKAGELETATESFRNAASRDRDKPEYELALANTLAVAGHNLEARQTLLRMRESNPENAEINIYLARLEAKAGELAQAESYYHNALYGRWTGSQIDRERRQVRVELIHFLLDHGNRSAALPELLILSTEIPETDREAQIETGQLLLQAGDPQHALECFNRALALDRHNADALVGGGEAAFLLGDYAQAQRLLEAALVQRPDSQPATEKLALARIILANDAMAPHLSREERNQRIIIDFKAALDRLHRCSVQSRGQNSGAGASVESLNSEAFAMRSKLNPENLHHDSELVRSCMELIFKIEESTNDHCGKPTDLDQALLLIGKKHEGALR